MVNVVFASGLIRTPYRFMHSVIDFYRNKRVSKIVLSVWIGEIDKYQGLREFLTEHKVVIIETEEPNEVTTGFINHQMVSLEKSLGLFNDNDLIFKTRCDLYIDPEFFDKLIKNADIWSHIQYKDYSIFKNKIWVMYYELTKPFYLGDECFCGKKRDVNLLINYNNYDETIVGSGITHIRRYIDPFIEKFPILKMYIYKSHKLSFISDGNRFELLNQIIKTDIFIIFQYLFMQILRSNFYVEHPDRDITTNYYYKDIKINNKKYLSNFSKDFQNCERGGQIFVFNLEMIDNLFLYKICKNEVPQLMWDLIKIKKPYSYLETLYKKSDIHDFENVAVKPFIQNYSLRKKIYQNSYKSIVNEIETSPISKIEKKPIKHLFLNRIVNYIKRYV
ncbi:hypothetical protein N9X12_01060 [Alphaproteobacteria bacterium]|nr:hypothetical protein [Alphaproteobacteria bacterium]